MKSYNINNQKATLFVKYGAFVSFSCKKTAEMKKEGVEYLEMGNGLVCPRKNCKILLGELEKLSEGKIAWELKHNTRKELIWHSLANYECQLYWDTRGVVNDLADYGITKEEIDTEYQEYCDHCREVGLL